MNYLVCSVLVIGTLTAGHTLKEKREVSNESYVDNQTHQQDIPASPQVANGGYDNVEGGYGIGGIDQNAGSSSEGRISHITINKQISIPQPIPVPVEVENKVPFPLHVPVPVPVDRPYNVKIQRPYLVPVYKDVPFPVYKDVAVPVKFAVQVPYLVRVPVLVPRPFPIPIDVPVRVPIADVQVIRKPVVLEQQERENGGGDVVSEPNGALDVVIGGGNAEIGASQEIAAGAGENGASDLENGSARGSGDIGEKH